jgi:replicative DNA helicase
MSLGAPTQFLNKLLQEKDFSIVLKNGLTENHFFGFQSEFNFICNHYDKYGNVPDILTFKENFPNFELFKVEESYDYLISTICEEEQYHRIVPFIQKLEHLSREDARQAYDYIVSAMPSLRPHSICEGTDIISEADLRYQTYLNRNANEKTATISTGFDELDDILGGWEMGEELITVVGRSSQGKSWIGLKFLTEAWKQGYRVGLYSGEMSATKLGYRFDALNNHFSNRALTNGRHIENYGNYITQLSNSNKGCFRIITQKELGGRATIPQLRNFVEANKIQILGIDQYSLMDDCRAQRGDTVRNRLAHISEDLFLLSTEYKIPIIALAQANRDSLKKDDDDAAPGMENIKESDDIAHNSSKIIGMKQSKKGLIFDVVKNREGRNGDKIIYSWDIDTGHFVLVSTTMTKQPVKVQTISTISNDDIGTTVKISTPF